MSTLYSRLRTALVAALLLAGGAVSAQSAAPCSDDAPPGAARQATPPGLDLLDHDLLDHDLLDHDLLDPTPPDARSVLAADAVVGALGGAASCSGAGRLQAATYDEAGRLLSILYESWVPDAQAWVPSFRSTYAYDEGGRTTTQLSDTWDVPTQAWVAFRRTTTTSDAEGRPQRSLSEIAGAEGWENQRRATYTYASDSLLTEFAESQWTEGAWTPSYRFAYAYDEAGRTTEYAFQSYFPSGAAVQRGDRSLYTYDATGERASIEYQGWSAEAQVWVPNQRQTFSAGGTVTLAEQWAEGVWTPFLRATRTYDGDRLTLSVTEQWDASAQAWVPGGRSLVTHASVDGGAERTYLGQTWRVSEQAYVDVSRTTYGYDAAERLVLYRYEVWSPTDEVWLVRTTQRSAYDAAGNRTEFSTQRYAADGRTVESGSRALDTYNADGRPTTLLRQVWDLDAQAWANSSRSTYEYDRAVDAGPSPEAAPLAVAVYPNPTAGPATLRLTTAGTVDVRVEVYDALGRRVAVVHDGPAAAGTFPLDVARLAPGVYTARAVAEGRVAHRPFTVVR